MISFHKHCSSATSVTLIRCFSDLSFSADHLSVQLLSPSLYFFSPSHSLISVFPRQGERISCNVVCCICTSWERQGELGRQGSFHLSVLCEPLAASAWALALSHCWLLPFRSWHLSLDACDLYGASSTQYTCYSFLHLHCQLLAMCCLLTNLC